MYKIICMLALLTVHANHTMQIVLAKLDRYTILSKAVVSCVSTYGALNYFKYANINTPILEKELKKNLRNEVEFNVLTFLEMSYSPICLSKDAIPIMFYEGHKLLYEEIAKKYALFTENVPLPIDSFIRAAILFQATSLLNLYTFTKSPSLYSYAEHFSLGGQLLGENLGSTLIGLIQAGITLRFSTHRNKNQYIEHCLIYARNITEVKKMVFMTVIIFAFLGIKPKEQRITIFKLQNVLLISLAHTLFQHYIEYNPNTESSAENCMAPEIVSSPTYKYVKNRIASLIIYLIIKRLYTNAIPIGATIVYTLLDR